MEEAPENGKEWYHSAHQWNEWMNILISKMLRKLQMENIKDDILK
jgi:hypothetical protein